MLAGPAAFAAGRIPFATCPPDGGHFCFDRPFGLSALPFDLTLL